MAASDNLRLRLVEATAGDYDIIAELGRGGMATVYLAHDRSLDRRVAIKVMAPELLAVDGMAERFLLEARVAAALSHPQIVPIHAIRRVGDLLFFVMKFVAGRSLDAVVASGPLSVPMVRAILTQVGAALEAAHRRGIVHRDIKPANILLDEHGDAVVADFGIARLVEQKGHTMVGQTVGTPSYMSPEQCSGEPLSGAADQYSLGVVAYELLTGAPPFTGDSLMQVVWRMVHEEIVPLDVLRPDCAGPIATTVHRMLAHRAEDRWPSVAEAVSALPPLALGPDDPVRQALVALATSHTGAPLRAAAATVVTERADTAADAAVPPPEPAVTLRLQATAGTMTIDDALALVPEVLAADGTAVESAPIEWTVSDSAVARVSAEGLLTAVGIGRASVTARCREAVTTLAVTVTRAGVRGLAIAPRPSAVEVGDLLTLSAIPGEGEGPLPHPRLVDWSSDRPDVARVDALGRVRAMSEGNVVITARTGGTQCTIDLRVSRAVVSAVHVTPPTHRVSVGDRLRLEAEPANTKGHALPGYPVRWEVSDAGIATISPDGVLTALRSGQVLIAARVSGRVGLARVTVAPR